MINVLCHLASEKRIRLIMLLIPFIVLTSFNLKTIFLGYYHNFAINQENDQILKETSTRIKNGEEIFEVELKQVFDIIYSGEQPYYPGNEYMLPWIRHYYELPEDIILIYR